MEPNQELTTKIEEYVIALVNKQPRWIRDLFDEEKIFLAVNDDCSLSLMCVRDIDFNLFEKAFALINKYFRRNPTSFIRTNIINYGGKNDRIHCKTS